MRRISYILLLLLAPISGLLADNVFNNDNNVYLTDGSVYIGSQYVLPVRMRNTVPFVAYQMDLYLPSGVSVAMNGGQMAVSGARMSASHILECSQMSDGAIRLLCYSNANSPLTGNDGVIANITLNSTVTEDCELPIIIRNVRLASLDGENDYVSSGDISCILTFAHEIFPVSGISLSPETYVGYPGDTLQITASVTPSNATNKVLYWSSSDSSVATVNQQGQVLIEGIGDAVITATAGDGSGVSATCQVTANPIMVSFITLDRTSISGYPGDTFQLTATVLPDNASDKGVVWSSSDNATATVSQSGLVTIVTLGDAVITATAGDGSGVSATCQVTANPIMVSSITLDRTSISGYPGDTFQLTATVLPDNASDKGVVWSSSDNATATVSQSGLVTLIAGGYAVIVASTTDGSSLSAQCTVSCTTGNIVFADAVVKSICVSNWDLNGDGELSNEEAAAVTALGDAFHNQASITSFCELRYFTGLSSIPSGTFQGCDNLLAVAWSKEGVNVPRDIMSHPNSILYITSGVRSEYGGNTVTDGVAYNITLTFGQSLLIPEDFKALRISCSREFTKTTYRGQSAGWEAMVLPYNVDYVIHETSGEIYPFGGINESKGNNFWLGRLLDNGFEFSDGISANVPFIISMPYSPDYAEQYNLNGMVTFEGVDAQVHATTAAVPVSGPGFVLTPAYMPVEASSMVYPLNDTEYYGHYAGSVFVGDSRQVRPFESYVRPQGSAIPQRYYGIGENGTTAIRSMIIDDCSDESLQSVQYNLFGLPVDDSYHGVVIRDGVRYLK